MTLHIENPQAVALAQALADQQGVSVEQAVLDALKASLAARRQEQPLEVRARVLASRLQAMAAPGGRSVTKDEVDTLWGHE